MSVIAGLSRRGTGERNFTVTDPAGAMRRVLERFRGEAVGADRLYGNNRHLHLRCSSTELLVRLNIEARGDQALAHRRMAQLAKPGLDDPDRWP